MNLSDQKQTVAPVVSIIVPTYNHKEFVFDTLASIWAQTFTDYELIVINDGSSDDTAGRMRPLSQERGFHYIEQTNAGMAAARNLGIRTARGEFIALLDDDDLWPADKLAWQVEALRSNPSAVVAYGQVAPLGAPPVHYQHVDYRPSGHVYDLFLSHNWIESPGQALIRASALHRIGGFDPAIWGCDDWDLWLRLARLGPFLYAHHLALEYRMHGANASKNRGRMLANARRVTIKHGGAIPRHPDLRAYLQKCWTLRPFTEMACRDAARDLNRAGERGAARRLWRAAARIRPSVALRVTHSAESRPHDT